MKVNYADRKFSFEALMKVEMEGTEIKSSHQILLEQIEQKKITLQKLAKKYGKDNEKILKYSQELDELIVAYNKLTKEEE